MKYSTPTQLGEVVRQLHHKSKHLFETQKEGCLLFCVRTLSHAQVQRTDTKKMG